MVAMRYVKKLKVSKTTPKIYRKHSEQLHFFDSKSLGRQYFVTFMKITGHFQQKRMGAVRGLSLLCIEVYEGVQH